METSGYADGRIFIIGPLAERPHKLDIGEVYPHFVQKGLEIGWQDSVGSDRDFGDTVDSIRGQAHREAATAHILVESNCGGRTTS